MTAGYPLAQFQHFLNGFPQPAFRIEHKLGGKNNFFAFFQTFKHLKFIIIALETDFYLSGLELTLAQGDENSVVVETDDNIIDRVYTKVKDNTLELSYASGPLGLHLRPTKGYI